MMCKFSGVARSWPAQVQAMKVWLLSLTALGQSACNNATQLSSVAAVPGGSGSVELLPYTLVNETNRLMAF